MIFEAALTFQRQSIVRNRALKFERVAHAFIILPCLSLHRHFRKANNHSRLEAKELSAGFEVVIRVGEKHDLFSVTFKWK